MDEKHDTQSGWVEPVRWWPITIDSLDYYEFPMSKEDLKAFQDTYFKKEEERYVDETVDFLVKYILHASISGVHYTKCSAIKYMYASRRSLLHERMFYIDKIMAQLKERFPDTLFTVDDLGNIIADWR